MSEALLIQPILHLAARLAPPPPISHLDWAEKILSLDWKNLAALFAIVAAVLLRAPQNLKRWAERRILQWRLRAVSYSPQAISRARQNFVEPDCQDEDPALREVWRSQSKTRVRASRRLDLAFRDPNGKYTLLLADSAMGKTSVLINYFYRWGWWKAAFHGAKIVLIPLSTKTQDQLIERVQEKSNTILLLDGFDEDFSATKNHQDRLRDLLDLTQEFRHVLISCRTHFFKDEEDIPSSTHIPRAGVTGPRDCHNYTFARIYLSPFSDMQVERYIRRVWPLWRKKKRAEARELAKALDELTVRPLFLAFLGDLLKEPNAVRKYKYTFKLYDEVVRIWCDREEDSRSKGAWWRKGDLRMFSERVALAMYSRRVELEGEWLPLDDTDKIARQCNINVDKTLLRANSLLNRDSRGHLKFAHRVIMEYLYVCAFLKDPKKQNIWTSQMEQYFLEMALYGDEETRLLAGRAAVHVSVPTRRRLIEHSHQLSRPVNIERTKVSIDVNSHEFLIVAVAEDSATKFLAVSKEPFKWGYAGQFRNGADVTIDGSSVTPQGRYGGSFPEPLEREILKAHHLAAYGVTEYSRSSTWSEETSNYGRLMSNEGVHIEFRLRPRSASLS